MLAGGGQQPHGTGSAFGAAYGEAYGAPYAGSHAGSGGAYGGGGGGWCHEQALGRGATPPRGPASGRRPNSGGGCSYGSDSGAVKLPPLPRPPSADDVDVARKHLVLLKARMGQRAAANANAARNRDRSAGPAAQSSSHRASSNSPGGPTSESAVARGAPPRTRSVPPRAQATEEAAEANSFVYGAPSGGVKNSPPPTSRKGGVSSAADGPAPFYGAPPGAPSGGVKNSPPPTAHARKSVPAYAEGSAQGYGAGPEGFSPGGGSGGGGYSMPAAGIGAPGPDDEANVPQRLVQCEDCGRSFNENALERHQRICKKVFMQKRKQFDSAASRLGELDNANQLISNAREIKKEIKEKEAKSAPDAKKADEGKPMPKWKKDSLAFRQQMLAAKAAAGDAEAQKMVEVVTKELNSAAGDDPDKVSCPHCGRTFNKESAERHINICLKTFGGNKRHLVKGGGTNCNSKSGDHGQGSAGGRGGGAMRGAPPSAGGSALGNAAAAAAPGAGRPGGGIPRWPVTGGYGAPAAAGQGAPAAAKRSRSASGLPGRR